MIKKCRVCGCEKDISCFVKDKHCLSGYENICKQCKNERMKVYKKTPKYKAYRKSYYQKYKNKEKANIKNRQNRNPLLCRSKLLYAGMRDRAREKGIDFDKEHCCSDIFHNSLMPRFLIFAAVQRACSRCRHITAPNSGALLCVLSSVQLCDFRKRNGNAVAVFVFGYAVIFVLFSVYRYNRFEKHCIFDFIAVFYGVFAH